MLHSDHGVVGLGYQGLSLDEYVSRVVDAGADIVVDVRLNAISRKPGFSKTRLSAALGHAGVQYEHFRMLGNPKDNRQGFWNPDSFEGVQSRRHFANLLRQDEPWQAVRLIADLARERKVVLLCFEACEEHCHRSIILKSVQELLEGASVISC
ncbi:DUF488 domain-containing protein [Auritidibacter ignavus]|uniref:DUF488 domain-containing protein n=1 Tax=Auritidibacter ignavus TaxID=678932 RepID=UPI002FE54EE2